MLYKICEQCGEEYRVHAYRYNKSKYCSVKCLNKSKIGHTPWNKGLTKNDDKRLMSISKQASKQLKREYANGTRDRNTITRKANEFLKERTKKRFENGNYKKCIGKRGYTIAQTPDGQVYEHHLVWQKHNGDIPLCHVVHHINGDKTDNRLENLQCMPEIEHLQLHDKERQRDDNGRYL